MEEQILTRLYELGALVVGMFLVWQIIRVLLSFFTKNEEGNQAEKGGLYRLLTDVMLNVSSVITKNSEVLTDVKVFLATEMVRKSDIARIESLINLRADTIEHMIRKAHPDVDLDVTIAFPDETLDKLKED